MLRGALIQTSCMVNQHQTLAVFSMGSLASYLSLGSCLDFLTLLVFVVFQRTLGLALAACHLP